MSWTYNVADLSTNSLYEIRFIIGDTISSDPILQDEEIQSVLTQFGSVRSAAIECCERISSLYARQADYDLGPHSVKASQRSIRYEKLATKLRNSSNVAAPIFTNPQRIIFDIDMMNDENCSHDEEE